ncbi:hypothetical protein [Halobaculum sp. MBLA0143]|uniref:DUF7117 family protein n=1 Tax=Halobaculum sp. MBLA0143 TaxID=3079933 RepID=UPI003523BC0D
MEIRGRRECKSCDNRWSYFETGSIECPECGSLESVGSGDREHHTDGHEDLELTDLLVEVDETPLSELTDDLEERCRSYLATRGFLRGGELRALDEAYLVAAELRQAADIFSRLREPTDPERLYVVSLLRAADTGERPSAAEVPRRLRPARGLAAARAVLQYRSEVTTVTEPTGALAAVLSTVRDRAKRAEALQGDVEPTEADALVAAAREVWRHVAGDDDEALDRAREQLTTK